MIELEGRMVAGLDEFMLRLGHLKVLCAVAAEVGGSWFRVNRAASKLLTSPFPIPINAVESIADYLRRKRLCPVVQVASDSDKSIRGASYRYPDLVVEVVESELHLKSLTGDPKIWWQDLCLASPGIQSRVGGVTISAKGGSKTGLSHISDWAQFIGLISRAGEISPIGRLIVKLRVDAPDTNWSSNPYIVGLERLALGFTIIGADIDCFSRLAPKLLCVNAPIRKAEGAQIFAMTVEEIAHEAREARYLSVGRKNTLYENMRDLEHAARRGKRKLGSTSTAWHRASSRLESYVDLGLLEKGRKGEEERFEYVYYPTEALERSVQSLEEAKSARDWLERYLAFSLFGHAWLGSSMKESELLSDLSHIVSSLARPTAPVPIDALAIGLVWRSAARDERFSIASARQTLEHLAVSRPELARLSRGGSGERAEFISLDMRKLEGLTA